MSRMYAAIAVVATASLVATSLALAAAGGSAGGGGGGGKPSTNAIWINSGNGSRMADPSLKYGMTFTAGYSSDRASYPWGHAECWAIDPATGAATGSAFWGEWRALQADGTIGVFDIVTANGSAWPSAGATCTLSLVNTTPKYTVLATTTFTVAP